MLLSAVASERHLCTVVPEGLTTPKTQKFGRELRVGRAADEGAHFLSWRNNLRQVPDKEARQDLPKFDLTFLLGVAAFDLLAGSRRKQPSLATEVRRPD